MQFLYNILTYLAAFVIALIAPFNLKIKLFHRGRRETFLKLKEKVAPTDQTIWMHCASLGEFEQGRPVLEKIKLKYPTYKIVLSFFSPSGYEVRKTYKGADVVVYLPLDTPKNVKRFIAILNPNLAVFVKYEIWPNLLKELAKKEVPTILISGIFRKDQIFFKKYGRWSRNALQAFTHFFVQDQKSALLLNNIKLNAVSVVGDTRFDRVNDIVTQRKELAFLTEFTKDKHTLVAGSTWTKDEDLLVDYINKFSCTHERFIFAPHNINQQQLKSLVSKLTPKTYLYSEVTLKNKQDARVLIIDSIGILTSVYAYADVAYVGGGFGAGIHNILEPATYGLPIIIGPKHQKFKEAKELIAQEGCFVIDSKQTLAKQLQHFCNDLNYTKNTGKKASSYIQSNTGATEAIINYLSKII